MFSRIKKNDGGFTLIELLVVIVIIGLLAVIVIGYTGNSKKKAVDTQKKAQMSDLKKALEAYYVENDNYPPAGAGWQVPLVEEKLLKEAKTGDFNYSSDGTSYTLTIPLSVTTDKDPNNINGLYTLTNNQ